MTDSIRESDFDRNISLRDAYRVMEHFITAFHQRGGSSTVELIAYLGLLESGRSSDPAALDDFLESASACAPAE